MRGRQYFVLLFSLLVLFFFIDIDKVLGHSLVVQQTPSPNSQLESSPKEIIIAFNNKVERELVSLRVFDDQQQEVTTNKALISEQQQEIRLELPYLMNGVYHVHYYAISSNDGHPIKGSYSFQVSATTPVKIEDDKALYMPNVYTQSQHMIQEVDSDPNQQETSLINDQNGIDMIIQLFRSIYYIGLLLIIGWVFWWRNIQDYSSELKEKYIAYGMGIQILHLAGLISMILMQLNIFTNFDLKLSNTILTDSTFGLMWFISLGLSLIGFVLLFRNKWFDLIWILCILFSKSLNGHSVEFEPTSVLIISNSIHLLAASIWAAGLLFIFIFWRKQRLFIYSFLPIFSKYSLWSIVVLSITGLFTAISFLSSTQLKLTPWLLILLFKLITVITVIVTGGIIRSKLKKQHTGNLGILVKLDFILMLIIVILASIFTYLNPLS